MDHDSPVFYIGKLCARGERAFEFLENDKGVKVVDLSALRSQ